MHSLPLEAFEDNYLLMCMNCAYVDKAAVWKQSSPKGVCVKCGSEGYHGLNAKMFEAKLIDWERKGKIERAD